MVHYRCSEILGLFSFSLFRSMITPFTVLPHLDTLQASPLWADKPSGGRTQSLDVIPHCGCQRKGTSRTWTVWELWGVPSQLLSSRLSPCSWDGFLGFRPGFHSSFWGTVWGGAWGSVGTPWGNKTIVTEWIKMLKRHTTLQKTFLWSLYFSSLSIF